MKLIACETAPDDWNIQSIESVCKRVTSGGTPSRKISAFYKSGNILWVKTKELNDGVIYSTEEQIVAIAFNASTTLDGRHGDKIPVFETLDKFVEKGVLDFNPLRKK